MGACATLGIAAIAEPAWSATCDVSIAGDEQLATQATFASLPAGSTVCFAPGVYARPLVIAQARGTAAQPLTFRPQTGGGGIVEFTHGLLLRDAAWVNVSGLTVRLDPRPGPGSAITFDVGTHHAAVRGMVVEGAFVGIAIGSSAGPAGIGNEVADNVVRGSWNTGIGVSPRSDGTITEPNRIRHNRVDDSGGHGIEASDANFVAIEDNEVTRSGTGRHSIEQGGYSGIHLYASAPSRAGDPHGVRCTGTLIASNRVGGTAERPARAVCRDGSGSGRCADGNGIQVDRYCSGNAVRANVVTGNAGSGISVYGAIGNEVRGNTVRGNNQQVDRILLSPGPAEIAVHAIGLPAGSARSNVVAGNTATTTVHGVPAFFLSANAGPNLVGPDNRWLWAPESRPDRDWAPVVIGRRGFDSATEVDQATGTANNRVGLP